MATGAYKETLQFITNAKLKELETSNGRFMRHRDEVKAKADAYSAFDPIASLAVLVEGLGTQPGSRSTDFNLDDTKRFLEQARYDPTFPQHVIDEWIHKADAQFTVESTRYDYALLFGHFLDEWILSKSSISEVGDYTTFSPEDFEEVHEKDKKLESLIFEENEVDVKALNTYLVDLFSSKEALEELEKMRNRIKKFSQELHERSITLTELDQITQSVLQTDVLSEEKQTTLKEFLRNQTVMKELASVLNMQLSTIKSWSWPSTGVLLEPRRHLNGRTRFHLDTEILTCLLLHYLGMLWSVEFKKNLEMLFSSRIWKRSPARLTRIDHKRWDAFFGKETQDDSIEKLHWQYQSNNFFASQLPSRFVVEKNECKDYVEYDDVKGVDFWIMKGENKREPLARYDSPEDLKQLLLRILSADVIMNKTLHGRCTVVRTDLEWFNSSLSFATITTILRFFGVSEENIEFMESFLLCPVVLKDDPLKKPQTRRRGVPKSYLLSTLFGELVLFVMDFAVNQRADGLFLHRIHDSIWCWDVQTSRCSKAWTEMQRFARVAGITINVRKTGSVVIGDNAPHYELPSGDIRWGLLNMNTDGRFVVDRAMVNEYIEEFRRKLSAKTSALGWVQAYNEYITFIAHNCGAPTIAFGEEHILEVIETLACAQEALFCPPESSEARISFPTALEEMIEDQFFVPPGDIPYGWYFWPNAVGGLGVKNPQVDLFLVRDGYKGRSVAEIVNRAFAEEERQYADARMRWNRAHDGEQVKPSRFSRLSIPELHNASQKDSFFSFEELTKSREERGAWWCNAYKELLESPKQCQITCTPQIEASLKQLGAEVEAFGGTKIHGAPGWGTLRPYWQWLIAVHHDAMVKKFGSLAIVEQTFIPMGMVSLLKI